MAILLDSLRAWTTALDPTLLYWVGASLLACVLATNLAWHLRSRISLPPAARDALVEAARFLFCLGIPYLALGGWPLPPLSALLSLEELGLAGIQPRWPAARWLSTAGTGTWLGLGAFLLLLLAWKNARRGAVRLSFAPRPWWALLIDGLYLEAHWAFYRAGLAVALGDRYAGLFAGLGLIALEAALSPFWRAGWRDDHRVAGRWLRAALAVVSTLIYLLTQNLWLCLAVHWVLELAFWHIGRPAAAMAPADPPPLA
ncbi:MAG TPA: hypothetical protein PKO09_10550 [Anaerolineae bacterium]|nr:hypothetical protein [Anaerolineae bacterium]